MLSKGIFQMLFFPAPNAIGVTIHSIGFSAEIKKLLGHICFDNT